MKAHCKPIGGIAGIRCPDQSCIFRAEALAQLFAVPVLTDAATDLADGGLYLNCDSAGLSLQLAGSAAGPVTPVFFGAESERRAASGKQLLIKAIGGGARRPAVVDATAGLGRDSGLLHRFGFPLIMIERNAVLYAMLENSLRDAGSDTVQLIHADAAVWLHAVEEQQRPDVVYIDPMYPDGGKNAAVKKELAALRLLLDEAGDGADILAAALCAARHRVVVKRPLKAPHLGGKQPTHTVKGKAVRFDVYALQAFPKSQHSRDISPS